MKIVKSVCKFCQEAEVYTWYELFFRRLFLMVVSVLSVVGVLFTIYFFAVGPVQVTEEITSNIITFSFNGNKDLRPLAINLSEGCTRGPYDVKCVAKTVFNNLSDIPYVLNGENDFLYEPLYVYENGGDCKNTAKLYSNLLSSIGYKSKVICNTEKEHCVSKTKIDDERYYIVDLTIPLMIELNETNEEWDYYKIYKSNANKTLKGVYG